MSTGPDPCHKASCTGFVVDRTDGLRETVSCGSSLGCQRTPDHRLLHDFGTLRAVFGILFKDGQDIRVDSLFAFAQISMLQAVRRLRAMNAEVEVVANHR